MSSSSQLSGAEKARLLRRAQAVARVRHPNLVRLLPLPGGAGLSPVLGNSRRLADFTLPAGTFKRFELEQVVRLLLDVLSGLAALHEVTTDGEAFVHGHVSPQHIFIDEHGTARLVPILNAHAGTGATLDDAGYAAPERLAGAAFDARADVFSVGVMLWEALAGKRLFPAADRARAVGVRPPAIRLAPDARWAAPLCGLAERAIALDPAARFGSALELSNAMAAAAAQQLSNVDTDAWQEEAPTPVFQPRVHLATLRSATPEPAVLTLVLTEPVPAEAGSSAAGAAAPPLAAGRGGRLAWLALSGAAALALGLGGLQLSRSPLSWRQLAAFAQPTPARIVAPAAAPALASAAAPAPPSATPPVATPSASVAASAPAAGPAASTLHPGGARPLPRKRLAPPTLMSPRAKAKPTSRDRSNDYGI